MARSSHTFRLDPFAADYDAALQLNVDNVEDGPRAPRQGARLGA